MVTTTDQRYGGLMLTSFGVLTSVHSLLEWNLKRSDGIKSYLMLLLIASCFALNTITFHVCKKLAALDITGDLAATAFVAVLISTLTQVLTSTYTIAKCRSLVDDNPLVRKFLAYGIAVSALLYIAAFVCVCISFARSGGSVIKFTHGVFYNRYGKLAECVGNVIYASILVYVDVRILYLVRGSQLKLLKHDELRSRYATNQMGILIVNIAMKIADASLKVMSNTVDYMAMDNYMRTMSVAFEVYSLNKLGVTIQNILKPLESIHTDQMGLTTSPHMHRLRKDGSIPNVTSARFRGDSALDA